MNIHLLLRLPIFSRRRPGPGRVARSLGPLAFALVAMFLGRPQTATAVPTNDNFFNAQILSNAMTGQVTGTNVGSTSEIGEPIHAGVGGGKSVWYNWTPATSGQVVFTTNGSNFDTVMASYTGTRVAALTVLDSNDDSGNLSSQVTWVAQAGMTYHIAVDGYAGSTGTFVLSWLQSNSAPAPVINSTSRVTGQVGVAFSYQITASNQPASYGATALPSGVTVSTSTGLISGTPAAAGTYTATLRATNVGGTATQTLTIQISAAATPTTPSFFSREVALGSGAYYLSFATGNYFGYYSFLSDPRYIYHYDLGYEYIFDANDGVGGIYLYDFASSTFFYTSPSFPFPYLYDFSLNATLYYYPDPNPNNPGHYNTNGVRYFFNTSTGQTFSK